MQRQGFRPISRRENEEIRAICGKSRKVDETDDEDDEYDDAVEGSAGEFIYNDIIFIRLSPMKFYLHQITKF